MSVMGDLAEALEEQVRGMEWRMNTYPTTIDDSDHEALARAKQALLKYEKQPNKETEEG